MTFDVFDGLSFIGALLLIAGLAFFDWRWAVVAAGVLLLVFGVFGARAKAQAVGRPPDGRGRKG